MLKYKIGNLVDAFVSGEAPFAIHMCNCFCGFGKGFALELANKVPGTLIVDQSTVKADKNKLGTYSTYIEGNKIFLNCYGQYHYHIAKNGETTLPNGKPLLCNYKAVRAFLTAIATNFKPQLIAMPLIGCGDAHGDWNKVSKIIETELAEKGFEVVVYVLDKKLIPTNGTVIT